jgi:Rnl2 family RNA ligase
MDHLAYPKIPVRPDSAQLRPGGTWVATEKLHGAQLVVGCDGRIVRVGKRKAWLEDEPFFGWQLLRVELEVAARAVQQTLGGVVRLYGELFGGAYPHPDVAARPGVSAVQTGIWYSPDVHFALFDVLVQGEFLGHSEVEALAAATGLRCAPLVGRGPYALVDALPVRAPTRVPAWFGLPTIANNVAEGLVLKPDTRAAPEDRFVLKRKIAEFDDARFDEALPFKSTVALSLDELGAHAARLVNAARVASARSKVGTSLEAVLTELVLDVLIDLEAAFPAAWASLGTEGEERLREMVQAQATTLLG